MFRISCQIMTRHFCAGWRGCSSRLTENPLLFGFARPVHNTAGAARFVVPARSFCIGLNYRDHAAETGAAIPKEPVIFFKATTSLVGPNRRSISNLEMWSSWGLKGLANRGNAS